MKGKSYGLRDIEETPTHAQAPTTLDARLAGRLPEMHSEENGTSLASPEATSSIVSSPNTNTSATSSQIHMSDSMKIGPAAVAAAIADTSPSARLLKISEFPMYRQYRQRASSPQEMVEKDPLAAAMWRLYRSSATFLPESVRMENMTWRMMAMTLKRKEGIKYFPHPVFLTSRNKSDINSMQVDDQHPSKSGHDNCHTASSIQSPPFHRPSSAVPMRPFVHPPIDTSAGTVPYVPALSNSKKEFSYVQKRLRKTSMDVAMVSGVLCTLLTSGTKTSGRLLSSSSSGHKHCYPE